MLLKFTKMHGLGNDFVVIDAVTQNIRVTPSLVRRLANRKVGIGCDQVLVIEPPSQPDVDFNYRIFNQDGGEVEQCGNGARCFARYVHDRQLTGKRNICVKTVAGIMELRLSENNQISVDMGIPVLEPGEIPFEADQRADRYIIEADGQQYDIGAVSMGNPHAVLVVDDVRTAPVETLGPVLEAHSRFPNRVNVGFMQVEDRHTIKLRVFERGVGETEACGSGACAAVVAGIQQGLLDSPVSVHLTRGNLDIEWPGEGQPLIITGPAVTVFHGRIRI